MSGLAGATLPVVIPWQVSVEFLACLRRWESLQRITREQTTAYLEQFEDTYEVVMPTQGVLSLSLGLSSRYSLSHWDSLLVAACIETGVTTLFTEDLDSGAIYDSVSIVNPFAD